MDPWTGWELGRSVLLLAAVMYTGIWLQLSLFHRAGAFKHWAMYVPVIVTPLFVGGAVLGMAFRDGIWGWVAAALLAAGVLEGLAGLYYHLRGIHSQIGGFSMRNLL
ncbi:MAG: hypothetical protein M3135_00630, partial [Actinomycetota bacterium]|nr:hypothetical protein [Actinomycetota bacterium]